MPSRPSARALGPRAERRVRLYYRLRGYRVLAANARAGRNELDIVLRRGRRLVFCEVKEAKSATDNGLRSTPGSSTATVEPSGMETELSSVTTNSGRGTGTTMKPLPTTTL
jgi:hypothetical protein